MKLIMLKCQKCGHTWTPRTEAPKACPKCNNRKWDGK